MDYKDRSVDLSYNLPTEVEVLSCRKLLFEILPFKIIDTHFNGYIVRQ